MRTLTENLEHEIEITSQNQGPVFYAIIWCKKKKQLSNKYSLYLWHKICTHCYTISRTECRQAYFPEIPHWGRNHITALDLLQVVSGKKHCQCRTASNSLLSHDLLWHEFSSFPYSQNVMDSWEKVIPPILVLLHYMSSPMWSPAAHHPFLLSQHFPFLSSLLANRALRWNDKMSFPQQVSPL